jgi:UDP-N-acetylglucosamine 4-epimerase
MKIGGNLLERLCERRQTWLVTGAAGFIGSHLVEVLLELGQFVVGLDNFSTGYRENLDDALARVDARRFCLIEGDLRDRNVCRRAVEGVEVVLHQAALGSVPRSIDDPISTHESNVDGFVNLLDAARQARVSRFVYASSSSVYGDDPSQRKCEDRRGRPLSPYATTKVVDEAYADVYFGAFGLETVGLRYFNVFGPRQDPAGAYAAVIPRWTRLLLEGASCPLFGDGDKSRDFSHVDNVVLANLLAATAPRLAVESRVFNIACGERTTLFQLFELLREHAVGFEQRAQGVSLVPHPAKAGDIEHSLADINRARALLGYEPARNVADGLAATVGWFATAAHPHARGRTQPPLVAAL